MSGGKYQNYTKTHNKKIVGLIIRHKNIVE